MIIFKWERLNHQREIDEAERENFLRALPKVHAVLGQKGAAAGTRKSHRVSSAFILPVR